MATTGTSGAPGTRARDRRRYALASAVGGLLALVLFAILLSAGKLELFAGERFGSDFYDAQAKALMHGRWDVPPRVVGIDGFQVGDEYHMYFGIWPAILRMPALLVADSLTGELTRPSMLLGFTVLLAGAAFLAWRIRELFRPGREWRWPEAVIAGATVFAIGCGTTALALASRAGVYNEAILWGVAWSLFAYERIIAFVVRPSWGRLVAASGFTVLCVLSRVSIGIGPVLALGLVAVVEALRLLAARVRRDATGSSRFAEALARWGLHAEPTRRWPLAALGGAILPVLAYAWMNWSRFGSAFDIPYRSQVIAKLSADHRAMLDANGGSLFGPDLVPTTLLQALRPDALAFSPLFPWVTFQRFRTPIIGDAVFNKLDFTTSITASMPAFVLLGVLGVVAVVWTRVGGSRDAAALRLPLLGALATTGVALAFTFVAIRYLGDWIPLLTLAALAGLQVVLTRREASERRARWNLALAGIAVLALFGVWVNFGLGLQAQRLYDPAEPSARAGMLAFQYRVSDALGSGTPDLVVSPRLPAGAGRAGSTWITGDCRAMYWSDGRAWIPVEGKPEEGWVRVRADLRAVGPEWAPLVAFGPPGRQDVLTVLGEPGGVRFGLARADAQGRLQWLTGVDRWPLRGGPKVLDVLADRVNRAFYVRINRRYVLSFFPGPPSDKPVEVARGPVTVGASSTGGLSDFPGPIRQLRSPVGDCRRILARASS